MTPLSMMRLQVLTKLASFVARVLAPRKGRQPQAPAFTFQPWSEDTQHGDPTR